MILQYRNIYKSGPGLTYRNKNFCRRVARRERWATPIGIETVACVLMPHPCCPRIKVWTQTAIVCFEPLP